MGMTAAEILKTCDSEKVQFLRLQFSDILGMAKNVEVPRRQFEKALAGEVMFDGSSIEGFVRIEESDMLLRPDLDSFRIFPWSRETGKIARLICDIHHPDGREFQGCPRLALKRATAKAREMGFTMMAGPEAEFFIFHRDADGNPTLETQDAGGYFDMDPLDKGEECRRVIVNSLEAMGFEVEAAHHEVAPGQHEIDFKYAEAVETADNISTFRFVVKRVALDMNLHATFMPKPLPGQNGSGMHTHQSLFRGGDNAFFDEKAEWQLSKTAMNYIGGLLAHAPAYTAVANPTVNSYKRLVPGYEAPTTIAWSEINRSPLVRIPDRRGIGTQLLPHQRDARLSRQSRWLLLRRRPRCPHRRPHGALPTSVQSRADLARAVSHRTPRDAHKVLREHRAQYSQPAGRNARRRRIRSGPGHRRHHGQPLAARLLVHLVQPPLRSGL